MRITLLILFLTFWGCSSHRTEEHSAGLEIVELSPDKWTAITKQNLLHLAKVYDLSPFLYTRQMQIEPKAVPHAHPVLTLNTRYAEDPKKLLSAFLHEQFYWWVSKNQKNADLAVTELKKIYPTYPAYNGKGKDSTHLKLLIGFIQLRAMEFYLGDKEAREVITSLMKKDRVYPWVYYQILNKDFAIKNIVKKYDLLPPPLF